MTDSKQAFPLCWPDGWKRTKPGERRYAKFNSRETIGSEHGTYTRKRDVTVADATVRILGELEKMGTWRDDVIISTNVPLRLDGRPRSDQREPKDPGAAVYWREATKPMRCMAVDSYTTVAGNLAAIAATLEAMRTIERHGGAAILERAFRGFAALPERASSPWRSILEFTDDQAVSRADVDAAYRRLALIHHPDTGGDVERFHDLNRAREAAYLEVR